METIITKASVASLSFLSPIGVGADGLAGPRSRGKGSRYAHRGCIVKIKNTKTSVACLSFLLRKEWGGGPCAHR